MSETDTTTKSEQAEERTSETQAFMRSVRRAPRRKYTPEEKIRIVLEGFRREATVNDLCRREGINPANYYSWTKEFMEAGKERLSRNTIRDATRHEINQLKRENREMKEIAAERLLETHRLKKRRCRHWRTDPQTAHERRTEDRGPHEGRSIPGTDSAGTAPVGCSEEHLLPVAFRNQVAGPFVPKSPLEPDHQGGGAEGARSCPCITRVEQQADRTVGHRL